MGTLGMVGYRSVEEFGHEEMVFAGRAIFHLDRIPVLCKRTASSTCGWSSWLPVLLGLRIEESVRFRFFRVGR